MLLQLRPPPTPARCLRAAGKLTLARWTLQDLIPHALALSRRGDADAAELPDMEAECGSEVINTIVSKLTAVHNDALVSGKGLYDTKSGWRADRN